MATFDTEFLYTLTPGGTNQYTVNGQIANGQAGGNAGDNVITVNESVPITFSSHPELNGNYTYIGFEPGVPGYVGQRDGTEPPEFYLFSNGEVPLNQNFNVQFIDVTVCFLAGTLIATPAGPVAVEDLTIGDPVLTADGRTVPVTWLGWQTVATLFGIPEGRRPVVIAAGALGLDLPARDLRVTSDHALLLDGVLVQAGALVNGTNIRRMSNEELGQRFTVFHIETENQEIILAEGVPAETFIDNVSRRCFDNYAEYEAMFGSEGRILEELPQPRAMSARQVPSSIRSRIARHAASFAERTVDAA
jgi:hypothetical protein